MNHIDNIVKWLKNYSENNGNLCFVVGISGGIDSATVSTLCAKTGIETHICSLPINQNGYQLAIANKHINWLKNNFSNVIDHHEDLTSVFNTIKDKLNFYDKDLAWANTKSRLRMVTLYQIASFYNGLVVGTGNKIEDFAIGFFTKYGDGGVDISPIADFYKTEIRQMAKELNIIEEIINIKPTDGLWDDNRTDEDQIGATYEELEWAMKTLSDKTTREIDVIQKYIDLNKRNSHKMNPIPIFKKEEIYTNEENQIITEKKINLFQEFFVESNPSRLDEYVFCLNKNLQNSSVQKLFLNINRKEYESNKNYFDDVVTNKLIQNDKLEILLSDNDRFTFNKLVDLTKELLPENSIVVVSNLDIFIPDTNQWKFIHKDFFNSTNKKVCLALARTEYVSENEWFEDDYAWNVGEFADGWVFETPLQLKQEDFPYEIPVGFAPTCDNHMFVLLSKTYDYVFNWAEKYRIYHYDIVRKPDVIKSKRGKMIINEKTYKLPNQFLIDNAHNKDISPRFNWEELFNKIKNENL